MTPGKSAVRTPRWYWIPARVLIATFLLTLVSMALALLTGILVTVIGALLRGVHPNMTVAYRHFAAPVAAIAACVALLVTSIVELRRYRQAKALAEIERTA